MTININNKVAIVTGASRGIGEGIARVFANEGASVICVARSKDDGIKVVNSINNSGGKAEFIKADIREEIDRLKVHEQAAHDMIEKGGPIGRKLDFICQEFNREVNTLCAKSIDIELTKIGMEMKSSIEQFREQIQNIE